MTSKDQGDTWPLSPHAGCATPWLCFTRTSHATHHTAPGAGLRPQNKLVPRAPTPTKAHLRLTLAPLCTYVRCLACAHDPAPVFSNPIPGSETHPLHSCAVTTPIQKPTAYGTRSHSATTHIHTLLLFSYRTLELSDGLASGKPKIQSKQSEAMPFSRNAFFNLLMIFICCSHSQLCEGRNRVRGLPPQAEVRGWARCILCAWRCVRVTRC